MPHLRIGAALAGLLLTLAGPLRAQAWDAPAFLPPRAGDDIGAYFVDPPHGDWGVVAIWRQTGNLNLGVRVGAVSQADATPLLFGAETFGTLVTAGAGLPLDVSWMLGLGATLDEATHFRIPAGIGIGRVLELGRLVLEPYALPRAGLDVLAVGDRTHTEVSFVADLGLDVRLGTAWLLRLGATLGEHDARGIGVAYRFGRRAVVR